MAMDRRSLMLHGSRSGCNVRQPDGARRGFPARPVTLVRRRNFDGAVALARSQPGTVTAAHAGPGTPNHLALLQLENLLKLTFNIVPHRGSGPALVDVPGDQISSSMAHIESAVLQALVVPGLQAPCRDGQAPDKPDRAHHDTIGRFCTALCLFIDTDAPWPCA